MPMNTPVIDNINQHSACDPKKQNGALNAGGSASNATNSASAEIGCFTRTLFGPEAPKILHTMPNLPFDSWLSKIGNTPVREVEPGVFAKLEGLNPGGSGKDRAITAMVLNMLREKKLSLDPACTLALCTSGWAGVSLMRVQVEIAKCNGGPQKCFRVVVCFPASYRTKMVPARILRMEGIRIYENGFQSLLESDSREGCSIVLEDGNFEKVVATTRALVADKGWSLLDQHYDASGLQAHASTALELTQQLPTLSDVVVCTGSGATAAGLRAFLPAHIRVHSRPAPSGTVDGLTDVRRYNNFCPTGELEGYDSGEAFCPEAALEHEARLAGMGITAGQSSGASYSLARRIRALDQHATVAFISADGAPADPGASPVQFVEHLVLGAGPVGSGVASELSARGGCGSIALVHDPSDQGAHADVSRLARLSLDADAEEYCMSQHALALVRRVAAAQAKRRAAPANGNGAPIMLNGNHAPAHAANGGSESQALIGMNGGGEARSVIPLEPGMLFLASPGTPLAAACEEGEKLGDEGFVRRGVEEVEEMYPGTRLNLPAGTLCWTHPVGLTINPVELCREQLRTAAENGCKVVEGVVSGLGVDEGAQRIRVCLGSGEQLAARHCYLMAGAANKELLGAKCPEGARPLELPELEDTYITAISTVRFSHRGPVGQAGCAVPPVILGQLDVPEEVLGFRANFSMMPEAGGKVVKARLSGPGSTEEVRTVKEKLSMGHAANAAMKDNYRRFFGQVFPFLEPSAAELETFERNVTYRSRRAGFNGRTVLAKRVGDAATLITTPGCFGVGVKFGPAVAEAAVAVAVGAALQKGMQVRWSEAAPAPFNLDLVCSGCGATVSGLPAPRFKCPNAAAQPNVDHVLMPSSQLPLSEVAALVKRAASAGVGPDARQGLSSFVKYRALLFPYRAALAAGLEDTEYVRIVTELDAAVKRVGGTGFHDTPLIWDQDRNVFVKNETGNVAQSHKARHFFNAMVYLLVLERAGVSGGRRRLAVASCGNAALAAATIARAAEWPIDVCIPDNASPAVVARLRELGADINICPRGVSSVATAACGEVSTQGAADPTVGVFLNLVEKHASIPFSVQGPECGIIIEGGQTLAWEILEAVHASNRARGRTCRVELGSLFVQVGGGALGAGLKQGFERAARGELALLVPGLEISRAPALMCVQPEGNAPLRRAFERVKAQLSTAADAARTRDAFMYPWEAPASVAHGLLDDETYDWVQLVDGMQRSGGHVVLVGDAAICEAKRLVEQRYGLSACHTGSVGLAGMLAERQGGRKSDPAAPDVVIISGQDRDREQASAPAPERHRNQIAPAGRAVDGIAFRRVESAYDAKELFDFNKKHGSNQYNFIPDGPVQAHFDRLACGETVVYGAFSAAGGELVGLISAEAGSGYWHSTIPLAKQTCWFICEFVVSSEMQGRGIGTGLIAQLTEGLLAGHTGIKEVYTTVHHDNAQSKAAFLRAGFDEVVSYDDAARKRVTTVLKIAGAATPPRKASALAANALSAQGDAAAPMRVLGIQSGNAVDGIDVGVFDFFPPSRTVHDAKRLATPLKYDTVCAKTYSFTPEEREYILKLRAGTVTEGNCYAEANYRLGNMFADAALKLLKESQVPKSSIHLVSSHGQTISGHPHWELGELSVIAQRTGLTTAGDFRPADVAAGGNGTPCTCTYDTVMLRPPPGGKWRVAINVGGTSSVTFLPPWPAPGAPDAALPLGLDPGLGVFFMDLTARAIDPALEYDAGGDMARGAQIHDELVEEWLTYKYYQQQALPIGVGPDDFPETLWQQWRAGAQAKGVSDRDLLASLTELTARQIARASARFGGDGVRRGVHDVILRGGVCANSFFVERLRWNMEQELKAEIGKVKTLSELGLDEESWETAMYAMLGFLCVHGIYNFQPSCTGAAAPVVGGKVAPGGNFHAVMHSVAEQARSVSRVTAASRSEKRIAFPETELIAPPRFTIGFVQLPSDLTLDCEAGPLLSQIPGVKWRFQKMNFVSGGAGNPELISSQVFTEQAERGVIGEAAACFFPRGKGSFGAVNALGLACTSMSLVLGPARVHAELARGYPVSSAQTDMATAVRAALRELWARTQQGTQPPPPLKLAVLTPYVAEVHEQALEFVRSTGSDVVQIVAQRSLNLATDDLVSSVSPACLSQCARALAAEAAEAVGTAPDVVFVSCSAFHSTGSGFIDSVEQRLAEDCASAPGPAVVTSNQALMWHLLRNCSGGALEDRELRAVRGYGRLFSGL